LIAILLWPLEAGTAAAPWGIDKLVHAAAFAVWALCLGIGGDGRRRRMLLGGLLLLTAPALLEALQLAVPGRTASIGDGVAGAIGIVAALLLLTLRRLARRPRGEDPWERTVARPKGET
jgi:VanZ family protein